MEGPKNQNKFKTDLGDFEAVFRELKIDLIMKTNEVNSLKTELETMNRENFILKQSLDKLNKNSAENQLIVDMLQKKVQEIEPKYFETCDNLEQLKLQYQMESSKNNKLFEDWQNATIQKSELIRKVNKLEGKQDLYSKTISDISQKMESLKIDFSRIKGDTQNVKEELPHINALNQAIKCIQNSVSHKYDEIKLENEKLKSETGALKQQCVKNRAKSEILESFLTANNCDEITNLPVKMILEHLKETRKNYLDKLNNRNEIIKNLSESLQEERNANYKLIKKIEEISKEKDTSRTDLPTQIFPEKLEENPNYNKNNIIEIMD